MIAAGMCLCVVRCGGYLHAEQPHIVLTCGLTHAVCCCVLQSSSLPLSQVPADLSEAEAAHIVVVVSGTQGQAD